MLAILAAVALAVGLTFSVYEEDNQPLDSSGAEPVCESFHGYDGE